MSNQTDKFLAHVQAFPKLLIKLRAELNNDLDMVLILAVIAERYYAKIVQSEHSSSAYTDPAQTNEFSNINTLSVSLYTEIPRETVRRKVGILVEKGWVTCDARGNLSPTEQAARDLAKGTAATSEYLGEISS